MLAKKKLALQRLRTLLQKKTVKSAFHLPFFSLAQEAGLAVVKKDKAGFFFASFKAVCLLRRKEKAQRSFLPLLFEKRTISILLLPRFKSF